MPDKLSDIKPNGRNPRLIRKDRMEKLREYLAEFGDLSGLVVNADGTIISGHQRSQIFKKEKGKLTILEHYDPPTADGTTARGFIELKDGSRFVYREVDWPQEKADRATIVANGNFGEWDSDILTNEWAFDIPELREFGVPEFVFGGADINGGLMDIQSGGEGEAAQRISLADRFGVPPFSVFDTRQGYWQERKRQWLSLGIKSELGRGGGLLMEAEQVTSPGLNYYRDMNRAETTGGGQSTLGAIPPNEKSIMKRQGKYAKRGGG